MQLSIGILFLAASLAYTQTPAEGPQFEVSSIKASDPSAPRPGRLGSVPIVTSPGRLTVRNAYLTELIKAAYTLDDYQIFGGPTWITSAKFDVEAKSTDSATRAQLMLMLRTLLAERFKLTAHRETKELAVYALVIAKNGPKFHALPPDQTSCWPACPGLPGKTDHLRQRDLPSLAAYLTRLSGDKPVIDKTGLTGYFGLDLDISKIMEEVAQSGGRPTDASIFEATANAIPDELGLKLSPTKAPVEIFVIDHVEKPSSN